MTSISCHQILPIAKWPSVTRFYLLPGGQVSPDSTYCQVGKCHQILPIAKWASVHCFLSLITHPVKCHMVELGYGNQRAHISCISLTLDLGTSQLSLYKSSQFFCRSLEIPKYSHCSLSRCPFSWYKSNISTLHGTSCH